VFKNSFHAEGSTVMSSSRESPRIVFQPGFQEILKQDGRFASDRGDAANRLNGWFDQLIAQSGTRTSPSVWLMLCVLSGYTFAGVTFLLTESLTTTALCLLLGLILPLLVPVLLRWKRRRKILQQLPTVTEELARVARTGRNLSASLQVMANDTAEPLGDELRLATRRINMGVDPAAAVQDLPQRTGVAALAMLTSAIRLHHVAGGDLLLLLDRLAPVIRERLGCIEKLQAATVASRWGAVMMLAVPPLAISVFLFRDPEYLSRLVSSSAGRGSLVLAAALQLVGSALVYGILRRSSRF